MDNHNRKYDVVFDIIDHPDNLTEQELEEILTDPECREIYNLICKADSATKAEGEIDIESEWELFSKKHCIHPRRRIFKWVGSRAASMAVIICSSIVAVAAGIAVTMAVIDHKPKVAQNSGPKTIQTSVVAVSDTIKEKNETAKVEIKPVMFEDKPLVIIMQAVEKAYDVKIKFNNKDVAELHLYYKFDPTLPLDEVVEQLNTFKRINIKRNGDTLTIE